MPDVLPFAMKVYKDARGYWRCSYRDHLNQRHERSLGSVEKFTKREILVRVRDMANRFAADPDMAASTGAPTLGQWVERFMELKADLREASLSSLQSTADLLIEHFGERSIIARMTTTDAADWVRAVKGRTRSGKPISMATVAKHLRNARAIFARAVRERARTGVASNPFAEETVKAPAGHKTWTRIGDTEFAKILAACPDEAWRVLFAQCRYAGLRLMESRRIEWGDIADGRLTVRPAPRSDGRTHEDTKHRRREVPVEPRLAALYAAMPRGGSGPCDGLPADTHALNAHGTKIARSAGLDYPAVFHTLRANREDEWLAEFPVLVVANWLGHSPRVAQQHYTRPTQAQFEAASRGQSAANRIAALEAEIARLKSAG